MPPLHPRLRSRTKRDLPGAQVAASLLCNLISKPWLFSLGSQWHLILRNLKIKAEFKYFEWQILLKYVKTETNRNRHPPTRPTALRSPSDGCAVARTMRAWAARWCGLNCFTGGVGAKKCLVGNLGERMSIRMDELQVAMGSAHCSR